MPSIHSDHMRSKAKLHCLHSNVWSGSETLRLQFETATFRSEIAKQTFRSSGFEWFICENGARLKNVQVRAQYELLTERFSNQNSPVECFW